MCDSKEAVKEGYIEDDDGSLEKIYRKMAGNAKAWALDEELRNNKEISRGKVAELRSWCEDSSLLPNVCDSLLVAFLHSTRYDLKQAKTVVQVYDSVRRHTPEVFTNRSYHSEEVQRAKGVGFFCILPRTTPDGLQVMVQALRNTDPAAFVYASSSKAQFLTMDAMMLANPTSEGYVCVFDMHGVTMRHMWSWGLLLPRKIFKYLQEGLPLRMQRIHFLNTTPLIDNVMKFLRPFIRKEYSSIFHFHKATDMEIFYEMVPRHCLPDNYGGSLPSLEILQGLTDSFLEEVDPLLTDLIHADQYHSS